jgi:hypothetical protein
MLPIGVVDRIRVAHEAGDGGPAGAGQLTAEGVPTAHGGSKWYPSTVRAVVLSTSALYPRALDMTRSAAS